MAGNTHESLFFKIGIIVACFKQSGNFPELKHELKISQITGKKHAWYFLNNSTEILSIFCFVIFKSEII